MDRDGTLLEAKKKENSINFKIRPPYQLSELNIFNDIYHLNKLRNRFIFIVISNQPDLVTNIQSRSFHNFINKEIKKKIKIDEFLFCECLEKNPLCKCYKPQKYLLSKAISKFNISIKNSYFIGDTWRDIKLANNNKIKSILIDRGFYQNLKEDFIKNKAKPNFFIKSFKQISSIIKN